MDRLNNWLTLIANVSVVAGIVFLAFEISQNSDAVRSNTAQAMAAEQAEFNRAFMNPDFAQILAQRGEDGFDSLSAAQKIQLYGFENSWLDLQQNLYYQYREGNLDPGIWRSRHRGIISVFRDTDILRHWRERGFAYADVFREYIDNVVIPEAAEIEDNN